jgi:hypothetical protein
MASRKEEAAGAAWKGADTERPIQGEDPKTDSLVEARRWAAVYRSLVALEERLLDILAGNIPSMPPEAQLEAERTNLPVLTSQLERFRKRRDYWIRREGELSER